LRSSLQHVLKPRGPATQNSDRFHQGLVQRGRISPYANFLLTLEQFSPRLDAWLQQAAGCPDKFACEAFYHADLADQFPCLTTGAVPSSVSCAIALSPLLDMRYLHAWRLLLDSLLSNSKAKDDIPFIRVFLERAVACMTSDTYLGVVLPPELTPNFAFHFTSFTGCQPMTSILLLTSCARN
jgi:hypothetical protein